MCSENKTRLVGLLLFFFFQVASPAAQAGDVLENTISVSFSQTPLKEALAEISQKGGFKWSYNAGILDAYTKVTLLAKDWTVRETLAYILGDGYTFKQSGEYLILKKNKKPQQRLSGYITDRQSGRKMANVTVYDRETLRSTATDENGYYELPVTPRSQIVISKLDYRDTVLQVSSQTPRFLKLDIHVDSMPQRNESTFEEELNRISSNLQQFFLRSAQKLNSLNVQDSLHRRFQISFLPGLGTNHRLSGNVINDWSINILAGYSRGNRIAEFAGLGNLTRENITGFQAAGVFNNVMGNATGLQAAGVYNYVDDTIIGVQWSGVVNMAGYGGNAALQAAGIFNLVPKGKIALQYAGIANQADTVIAMQAGGIWNGARCFFNGIQAAGIANHANQLYAAGQFAGLSNSFGRGIIRIQAAGISNVADTVWGCQIAGIINRARHVKGVQIGLINTVGEIDGVQIGLLNFSKKGGYMALEASSNDVLPVNAAFKSGVNRFYTILTAGYEPSSPNNNRLWVYGIGLGSRVRLNSWGAIHFDLLHRHVNEGSYSDVVQEWEQLAIGLDLHLGKHLSIGAGPTANLFISDPERSGAEAIRKKIVPANPLYGSVTSKDWLTGWLGWSAAVRILF